MTLKRVFYEETATNVTLAAETGCTDLEKSWSNFGRKLERFNESTSDFTFETPQAPSQST